MATAVEQQRAQERQAVAVFRKELDGMTPQIGLALPPHIPAERFARVVMTAVQNNPKLLECNRRSLFNSCMRAAQDGLLPDGREGAIVPFKNEASWLPMVFGIQKKARNSGDLSGINAFVVLKDEKFRRWIDESGEHLLYEPNDERPHIGSPEDAAKYMRCVLATAKTKDGEMFVEVMSVAEVERVRAVSRASKDESPWFQWYGEMAKKTAVKRIAKRLPMSSDLDDLIRRDDELYDLSKKPEPTVLDLDNVDTGRQLPASSPTDTSSPVGGGSAGANASKADGDDGADRDRPPAEDNKAANDAREPTQLEQDIAEALLDCKTERDCDAIRRLFQKELIDCTDAVVRAEVEKLIDARKQSLVDAHGPTDDDFPGDRQPR